MNRHPLARRLLPLALASLLAACASTPTKHPEAPTPASPAPPITAATPTVAAPTPPPAPTDVWGRLRDSFAMADCDADAAVLAQAQRYTRHPQRFEDEMRRVLPKLVYVQQVAAAHDVAGEFALLPWVESRFLPVHGRHDHHAAGMWQIMPATAKAMGLRVDKRYDARLDVQASAAAVMTLLGRYHDEFHDWRLADYAYNSGERNARQLLDRHGMPPASPTIPAWPVRRVTREHLTRLLAMACVVRQPDRFHVSLPTLTPAAHLVSVPLPYAMPLARAADRAGMTLGDLKDLNAAFRHDVASPDLAAYLVLPAAHAQQFRAALAEQATDADADADTAPTPGIGDADAAVTAPTASPAATHRVQAGESLWQLARHYAVSVQQLERWNHLRGGRIKPGQLLKVGAAG